MKEWLKKQLKAKEEARAALKAKGKKSEDVNEVRSIGEQLDALDIEIAEFRSQIDAIEVEEQRAAAGNPPAAGQANAPAAGQVNPPATETRAAGPVGAAQILATYGVGSGQPQTPVQRGAEVEDPHGTLEYRRAFMDFCQTGRQAPELRADAASTSSDVSAVIPTTILNEVIKKLTVYGRVFAGVRKLSIKGGVTVPISSVKPVATWIGETSVSDRQKLQLNTNVSFNYYGLECKIATSLLADTVTLAIFENTVIDLITEAMIKATEIAIVSGNGTGKCVGMTADNRVPAAQIITLSPTDFKSWESWKKKVFAKMPLAYKAGASFLMASGTFEGYIDGMVDTTGQPIGRINYNITEGPQERFGGKPVIEVEDDVIANYDDATTGTVVTIYCNLQNYAVNSNMQMSMFRYLDHDTNEWVDKAIMIMDGKLLDPNGVVIVKKGAAS
jgi:HK97 family phage major capsid protein